MLVGILCSAPPRWRLHLGTLKMCWTALVPIRPIASSVRGRNALAVVCLEDRPTTWGRLFYMTVDGEVIVEAHDKGGWPVQDLVVL